MDPLSALIGGGISAISNLIGGSMNASSTQAINAANLQQQMWSAEGGYLPGLVNNAQKAGLNPLAVLGSRGPNMAVQVGTQPGVGLQEGGRAFGNAMTQIDMESREIGLARQREELLHQAAVNKQTAIDTAIRKKTLDDLREGKTVSGPEPAVGREVAATAMKGAQDFIDWTSEQYKRLPSWVRGNPWDWRENLPEFRHTPW